MTTNFKTWRLQMTNPANILIRTSKATDAELSLFNAWCEVCGAKKTYGEMLHDMENDIICCNTEGCWTTRLNNQQEEIMNQFKIEGFHHVTEAGVAELWKFCDSWGTIGMLWDMKNQDIADRLMLTPEFNMTTYIKEKFGYQPDDSRFDDILIELHEELVDSRFAIQYCFAMNINDLETPTGRKFTNIGSIPGSEEWDQQSFYPQTEPKYLTIEELGTLCADNCHEKTIVVRIRANEDGYATQDFELKICGAEVCNATLDFLEELSECYTDIKLSII